MRNRVVVSTMVLMLAMAFSSTAFAQGGGRGNANPPGPAHDPKDLTGVWLGSAAAGSGPNAMTQWTSEPLPLTAEGKKAIDFNKSGKGPRAVMPAFGNDSLGDANPPGLLRTFVYGRPIQIIHTPDKIVQLFEWAHFWRDIWIDGRPNSDDMGPYWYGYSTGKWEGNTWVVDTRGLDARAWMDEWGTPFSESAKITERWRRLDRDNLELTIEVNDPVMYSRVWTSGKRMYRLQQKPSPDAEILEVIFAPYDEQEFNERIRNPAGGKK